MFLQEIFKGKQYKIEVLEDEEKELTIHQLTISKPMHKNMGKYTCTINDIQTGSYLDVEGRQGFYILGIFPSKDINSIFSTSVL